MRESTVEGYLNRRVAGLGGLSFKFVSPGRRGVSDRIVIFPGGIVMFIELKAPGRTLRPDQTRFSQTIKKFGALSFLADSKESVDEILKFKS